MSTITLIEAGVISAIISFVVSLLTVRFMGSGSGLKLPIGKAPKPEKPFFEQRVLKPPNKKVREKERVRSMEYETSPEHSAVLRKIASDMRSQLKGYSDSISRVPVPVIIPEISTMALWADLIRNHIDSADFDFETDWYRYIDLLREHSRLQANMFVDIEAALKEKLVGCSAVNSDNVSMTPPENTVFYNSELIAAIMRNWLDAIRGAELHTPIDNPTDLGVEDAKKYVKIPDARFLTLYNRKIASGQEINVEQLEGTVRELLLEFHEMEHYTRYRSKITENETEIDSIGEKLSELLVKLESRAVFKGLCHYSH